MSRRRAEEQAARDALLHRIRTEGIQVAYETSLAICRDPKAPAPAKATASTNLLRAGGMFDRPETSDDKELHERSPEELARLVEEGERLQEILTQRLRDEEENGGQEDDLFR